MGLYLLEEKSDQKKVKQFIRFPMGLQEKLIDFALHTKLRQLVDVIIRESIGWCGKELGAEMSLIQLSLRTKRHPKNISKSLFVLKSCLIIQIKKISKSISLYSINLNFDQWIFPESLPNKSKKENSLMKSKQPENIPQDVNELPENIPQDVNEVSKTSHRMFNDIPQDVLELAQPSVDAEKCPPIDSIIDIKIKTIDKDMSFASQIGELFNSIFVPNNILPRMKELTNARIKLINARRKDMKELSDWVKFFEIIKASDHLRGKNDRGWRASIDWVLNVNNYVKIIEGNYTNNQKQGGKRGKTHLTGSYGGK